MNNKKIIKDNKNKVVFIGHKTKHPDGSLAVDIDGSGFLYEKKYVISCAHVYKQINKGGSVEIFAGILDKSDGVIDVYNSVDLILVSQDEKNDVCVFRAKDYRDFVDTFTTADIEINDGLIDEGQDVVYIGFPLATDFLKMGIGLTLFSNRGMIGAKKYNGQTKKIDFLQIDSHINPSNSGSPVFSSDNGKILGIVSATITFNQSANQGGPVIQVPRNMGIVRPSIYIKKLIDEIK